MDFEFETTRTSLANSFAAAGEELLGYQPLVDTAVAAIPDTKPEKYAIAGTLPGILRMAGKMMGEDVSAAEKHTGDLTDEQIERVWIELPLTGAYNMGEARLKFARAIERAAIAAHFARNSPAEQPKANNGPALATAIASIDRGDDDEGPETPSIYTREEVVDLLKYEIVTDSGARTLRNGDTMEFGLPELTLLANRAAYLARQAQRAEQPAVDPRNEAEISRELLEVARRTDDDYLRGLLQRAASEATRFYGGMMAWKQTAQKKDRDWNNERMARVDERCAARAAAPASQEGAHAARNAVLEEAANMCEGQRGLSDDDWVIAKGCAMAIRSLKTPASPEKGGV